MSVIVPPMPAAPHLFAVRRARNPWLATIEDVGIGEFLILLEPLEDASAAEG